MLTVLFPQYRDPNVVSKIKRASGHSVHSVLDCHSEEDSQVISAKVLAPGKGKVIVLLLVSKVAKAVRKDVTIQGVLPYGAKL